MKRWKKLLWLLPVLILILGTVLYLEDYYRAGDAALAALASPPEGVTVQVTEDYYAFIPGEPACGLIFYPGGKVQYESYAPLLRACAEEGIACAAVKMPGNLAVLNPNAADGIREQFPFIRNWYIGGHSLGGAMAAAYAADHKDSLSGVILLAAYSTKDISQLPALCIYGTEDGVMNRENYEKNRGNLESGFVEIIISGGCHACFGDYGPQEGDGVPTISPQQQWEITAKEIADFIK